MAISPDIVEEAKTRNQARIGLSALAPMLRPSISFAVVQRCSDQELTARMAPL